MGRRLLQIYKERMSPKGKILYKKKKEKMVNADGKNCTDDLFIESPSIFVHIYRSVFHLYTHIYDVSSGMCVCVCVWCIEGKRATKRAERGE